MSHLVALFEGTDLSEDFKTKAEAIFQTAITEGVETAKVELEKTLKEDFDAKLETRIGELEEASNAYIVEELVPTVDKYLTAAVNEWAKESEVAIQSNAKVELAESFLTGLVGLAESHKLTLPEGEDQTVVLQKKIDELTEKAQTLIDSNIELQKENVEFKKDQVLLSVTSSLSESQKEKFASVSANVEFKNADQYSGALKSLVESYFPAGQETQEELTEAQKLELEQKNKKLNEGTNDPLDAYLVRFRSAMDK